MLSSRSRFPRKSESFSIASAIEIVAEISAAYTCASLGIVPTVRHTDYVGHWIEVLKEDSRAIIRAASQASKAADYILSFLPQTKIGEVP
jgi:antirestriction protein ArdC